MTSDATYTPVYRDQAPSCLVCASPLTVRPARGRKSGKPSILILCARDGRHFRAFISDKEYVRQILVRLEGLGQAEGSSRDSRHGPGSRKSSKATSERNSRP